MCATFLTPAQHRVRIAIFPPFESLPTSPPRLLYARMGKVCIVGTLYPLQDLHTLFDMVHCSYIARVTSIRRVAACLLSLLRRVLCITTRYVAVSLLGSLFVSFSFNGPMYGFAGNCVPYTIT